MSFCTFKGIVSAYLSSLSAVEPILLCIQGTRYPPHGLLQNNNRVLNNPILTENVWVVDNLDRFLNALY